ncbi:MAG: chromosome condensation regulator RCC1 [Chloroflexota bacterium]|nr:MAG: chromosome condensation regulator RCC1 [Chloroflexota bacterium]
MLKRNIFQKISLILVLCLASTATPTLAQKIWITKMPSTALAAAAVPGRSEAILRNPDRAVMPATTAVKIVAGYLHTCALTSEGGVKCWGYNSDGQLGNGTTIESHIPVNVTGLTSGVIDIAVGDFHTCAVTASGGLFCWGNNGNGRLGDGTTTDSYEPINVSGLASGVVAVAAGNAHTCALTTSGAVKCWGDNLFGILGDGTTTERHEPVGVYGLESGVVAITASHNHSCALTTSGGIKCWGWNTAGELGNGTQDETHTPTDVYGLGSGVAAVSAGTFDTCALTTAGGMKCWGYNKYSELGDGTHLDSSFPVDVLGFESGVAAIAPGEYHTCALTDTGVLFCWGYNAWGQLGTGSNEDSYSPAVVPMDRLIADVSAGVGHTCALTTYGGVKCWGENENGQLGDGTTTDSNEPINVGEFEEILPTYFYLYLPAIVK